MANSVRDQKVIDAAYEKAQAAISNLLLVTYDREFRDIHTLKMELFKIRGNNHVDKEAT